MILYLTEKKKNIIYIKNRKKNFTFDKKYVKIIIENNDIERNAKGVTFGIRFLI